MKTFAQWVLALTRGYIKVTGKKPDKLSKLKINMEAGQKVRDQEKVIKVDFNKNKPWHKEKEIDWDKVNKIDIEDFAGGGIAGMLGEPTYVDDNHRVPFSTGKLSGGIDSAIEKNKNLEDRIEMENFLNKMYEDKIHGRHMTPMPNLMEGIQHADRPPPDPELQVGPFIPEEEIYVEFDDGTIYYKDTGEFYNQEGKQVDSPSKGAKPVPKTMEAAEGGRVPFGGGGFEKARRLFLKTMGAGAAGTVAAKTGLFGLLKGSKSAKVADLTSVPIKNADGMPPWFKPLVNRVIKEGKDITNLPPNKGGAFAEREIVHSAKLGENQGVRVSQNLDDQTITVEYQSADNMGGVDDAVRLEYKAPEDIFDTGPAHVFSKEYQAKKKAAGGTQYQGKSKPTFKANEAWPYADNPFGHRHQKRNITFEGENTVTKVDDLYSDTSALKQFGTGKDLSKKELTIAKQKRDKVKKINTDSSEAELLSEMPKDFDFATGGRVPFVGGGWAFKLAKKYSQSKEYKKFIEKLFLKASNDIRKGEGMFKDLTTSQKITQHDNLTNEITKFQKTGELPESAHQYFGFNPEQKYADKLLKKQLKMTPEEELRQEFPGITDEMVNNILTDTNTQRIAEVKATMKEALKMQEKGMGTEEIINVFKNIKPTKHASGGRVGMLFGGGVWKKIIQNLAKEKGISPSAYLAVTNWKHLPEGIRKIISKSQFEKIKESRVEMFENLVDMAKTRKAFLENIEQGKKTPTAGIFEHLEKSFKSPVPHGVTDKDILQGEVILKNLKTGGKKGPELNASGGLAGMLGE